MAKQPAVGFDPQKMAKTLTDLGYGADIKAIQAEIARTAGQEAEALKDLQAWAAQIEDQRAVGAASAAQAWEAAKRESQVTGANIAGLFGGQAAGEAGAYNAAGQDMLSGLAASDASFDARMAPILGAQSLDYKRRAQGEFADQRSKLQTDLRGLQAERGKAFQTNLLDMMDMAWGRKQDILQYQTGQVALKQAKRMSDLEYKQALQDTKQGGQAIQSNNINLKAQKLALQKSQVELKKAMAETPGGVDWNDPATRSNIGNAAFSGALSAKNTFNINPRVALKNAQIALAQMGLSGDPRAQAALMATFQQILNLSHARGGWKQYRIKNGKLVNDPTKKNKQQNWVPGPRNKAHPDGKYYAQK